MDLPGACMALRGENPTRYIHATPGQVRHLNAQYAISKADRGNMTMLSLEQTVEPARTQATAQPRQIPHRVVAVQRAKPSQCHATTLTLP